MTDPVDLASESLVVRIADLRIAQAPSVMTTVLGSCVALCVYEPVQKIGGMLHCMLPQAPVSSDVSFKTAKYADTGVEDLLNRLARQAHVKKTLLTAKIFGGGHVLRHVTRDIGSDNVAAVRGALDRFGVRVSVMKTGGDQGCSVTFDLATGRVKYQVFGQPVEEV